MGKRRKGRKKRKTSVEVQVIGPPASELAEKVRVILEEELFFKEKRAEENPKPDLIWKVERLKNALYALEELERRSMQ